MDQESFEAVEAPRFTELAPKVSEVPRARVQSFAITLTLAALAAGVALYASSQNAHGSSSAFAATDAKGTLVLGVVVQRPSGEVTRLVQRGRVSPGDSLRFELSSAGTGFAGVLGIDSAGAVTAYAPGRGSLRALAAGAPLMLDETIVAGAKLGSERLLALSCTEPVPVAELVEAAERALSAASGDPKRVSNLRENCVEAHLDLERRAAAAR